MTTPSEFAQELLAAEMGVAPDTLISLVHFSADKAACDIKVALRAIEKALTRSPVCEDAREELVKALKAILAIDGPYCDSCHSDDIGKAFRIAKDALAKASLPGGGG